MALSMANVTGDVSPSDSSEKEDVVNHSLIKTNVDSHVPTKDQFTISPITEFYVMVRGIYALIVSNSEAGTEDVDNVNKDSDNLESLLEATYLHSVNVLNAIFIYCCGWSFC